MDSDEEARRAYLGLDLSIDKALNLGMDGYNAADNANIPDQTAPGDVGGTMTVGGHVDAGVSDNKTMNLTVTLVDYTDGPAVRVEDDDIDITYATDPAMLPLLSLSLHGIPDGTFDGMLTGTFTMTGDLEGTATLSLTMSGEIEDDGAGGIRRVLTTTHVTGTATSGDGTHEVDLTL